MFSFYFLSGLTGSLPVLAHVDPTQHFYANTFYLLLAIFQAGTSVRYIEVKLYAFYCNACQSLPLVSVLQDCFLASPDAAVVSKALEVQMLSSCIVLSYR